MLLLAIASLIIGSTTFYYASDLAMNDKLREDENKIKKIEKIILDKFVDSVAKAENKDLASLRKIVQEDPPKIYANGGLIPSPGSNAKKDIDAFEDLVRRRYGDLILSLSNDLYKKEEVDKADKNNFNSFYFLITTVSIRIIIGFLTFYLAQLFLKLYNYYLSLSDFYASRKHAIRAFENSNFGIGFKELSELFEFKYGTGLSPKSPVDTAIEIINALNSKTKQS